MHVCIVYVLLEHFRRANKHMYINYCYSRCSQGSNNLNCKPLNKLCIMACLLPYCCCYVIRDIFIVLFYSNSHKSN